MPDNWNSVSSSNFGDYFSNVQKLYALRRKATELGPTPGDIVNQLDAETRKAGFDPIGAINTGLTADQFFKSNPKFGKLEEDLARKIGPHNVTEVFDLVKATEYYIPTGRVIGAFYDSYRTLFARKTNSQANRGMDPRDLANRPSPFKQVSEES